MGSAKVSGPVDNPVVTASIPAGAISGLAHRVGKSLPVGNEGAGTVVRAGSSAAAQALAGRTVAVAGGAMYAQYRSVDAAQCLELPAGTPLSWAQDAIRNEIKVIESSDKLPLRYRQRRVGAKGDLTREIIASRDGNVGRLVERDGQPITAAEDEDERERLNDLISSPDDFYRHHRKDLETRDSVIKVVAT